MDALPIVQMDGKKTRLHKPKLSSVRESGRDNYHDFTFDHSYWSFDANDGHFASQEQVYLDLGTDVVDSAFEGEFLQSFLQTFTQHVRKFNASL